MITLCHEYTSFADERKSMIRNINAMIQALQKRGSLRDPKIIAAFEHADRRLFVLPENLDQAYEDIPLSIGRGQTISQPFTVAFMLELLEVHEGDSVLDIGCGSGWTTALLSFLAGKNGSVIGVERIADLAEFAKQNIDKLKITNAKIFAAEKKLGLTKKAPYDRILVSAAADEFPSALLKQLSVGGTLVIPVKNEVWKVKKISDTKKLIEKYADFIFVPLIVE